MKNTFKIFFLPAILCVAAISCSKENQPWDDAGGKKIRAGITEFGTKISINESGDNFELRWEEGDKLIVENDAKPVPATSVFSITNGPGEMGPGYQNAVFWGDALTGSSFTTFYSKDPDTYNTFAKLKTFDYTTQTQSSNGSTDHLKDYYCAYKTGQNSYSQISFNPSDDDTYASSLFKFSVKLPSTVTGYVKKLTFTACDRKPFYSKSQASKDSTSSLTLKFTPFEVPSDYIVTAYMMTSFQPIVIKSGWAFEVRLVVGNQNDDNNNTEYFKKFGLKTGKTLKGGAYLIDLHTKDMVADNQYNTVLEGAGTSDSPYLLFDAHDVSNMKSKLESGSTTYFKMMADIDCSSIKNSDGTPKWVVLSDGNNIRWVNFNGNNKTLSSLKVGGQAYPSFFGILAGECKDVTFRDFQVEQNSAESGAGVVGGYLSYDDAAENTQAKNIRIYNCSH